MTARTMLIPDEILIQGEFWSEASDDEAARLWIGRVLILFKDSGGEMWCAFECADQLGVQLISLGSVFFKGFVGAGTVESHR